MSSIRTLRVLCLLAAILTVQTAPAIANESITNDYCSKMVRAYIQKARRLAKTGELAEARNDVFLAWFFYGWTHTTKFMATGELSLRWYEYLFPQGKAFCLFDWIYGGSQSRLIYAQVRGDTFAVTWQAQLEQSDAGASKRNTGHGGARLPFVSFEGYRIVRELGYRPPADTPLSFYQWQPVAGSLIYGHIDYSGAPAQVHGWRQPVRWLTYRVPHRMPTRREYLKEQPQQYGPVFIDPFVGGQFVPNRPGSSSGHLVGQTFELPKIPGEATSPGEVPPLKSGGNSKPENEMSRSIGWTWTSHPVTVGYVMRHTDAKHPATIGEVHIKAGGINANWLVQAAKADSQGDIKCVVRNQRGDLVALTLLIIGQLNNGNYGRHLSIRLFRSDINRMPEAYIIGSDVNWDNELINRTWSSEILNKVIRLPGYLNLGVAVNNTSSEKTSGSIRWSSHPVKVGYVMRHTDAKHPATIGLVHIKAGDFAENWRFEVFRMDSAGGVKCVVLDSMVKRWVASSLLDAEKKFRRISGCKDIWMLEAALKENIDIQKKMA